MASFFVLLQHEEASSHAQYYASLGSGAGGGYGFGGGAGEYYQYRTAAAADGGLGGLGQSAAAADFATPGDAAGGGGLRELAAAMPTDAPPQLELQQAGVAVGGSAGPEAAGNIVAAAVDTNAAVVAGGVEQAPPALPEAVLNLELPDALPSQLSDLSGVPPPSTQSPPASDIISRAHEMGLPKYHLDLPALIADPLLAAEVSPSLRSAAASVKEASAASRERLEGVAGALRHSFEGLALPDVGEAADASCPRSSSRAASSSSSWTSSSPPRRAPPPPRPSRARGGRWPWPSSSVSALRHFHFRNQLNWILEHRPRVRCPQGHKVQAPMCHKVTSVTCCLGS